MELEKTILTEIQKENPCHFRSQFSKIFSWNELEHIINFRPVTTTSRVRIINHTERKINLDYGWKVQSWMSEKNMFPPSILKEELKQYHCFISDMSRVNKNVNEICRQLEETFVGSAVDAHIYFTIAEKIVGGFGVHWDTPHNLIIQVEGESEFKIWNKNVKGPMNVFGLTEEPALQGTMFPGDGIFIPKNTYHAIDSKTKRISISFPISFNSGEPQDRDWIYV